jgi:hypothetical protein
MWNSEAVKAYESGQGVVLVEKPYPHYEPVACADNGVVNWIADKQFMHEAELYTAPPQRTWIGLTNEETVAIELGLRIPTGYRDAYDLSLHDFAKAIEAKLKEKNT